MNKNNRIDMERIVGVNPGEEELSDALVALVEDWEAGMKNVSPNRQMTFDTACVLKCLIPEDQRKQPKTPDPI